MSSLYKSSTREYAGEGDVTEGLETADVQAPMYAPGHVRVYGFDGSWQQVPVPVVTVVDGRAALRRASLLSQVEAIIAQNPEAQDWFEYAPYWERTHPVVEQMRIALGLTHEQIDTLFLQA